MEKVELFDIDEEAYIKVKIATREFKNREIWYSDRDAKTGKDFNGMMFTRDHLVSASEVENKN